MTIHLLCYLWIAFQKTNDYNGKAFATSYTKSPYWKKYTNAEFYNAFYSLLSICTYNYYSNNNLFTYKIGDTFVPRYFSSSGIGAKTAAADLNYQGSTSTQPAWSMPTFREQHGSNYIFAGDIQVLCLMVVLQGKTVTE